MDCLETRTELNGVSAFKCGQQAPSPSLNPPSQYENADNDEKKAGSAARVIPPAAAIRPGGQCTDKE